MPISEGPDLLAQRVDTIEPGSPPVLLNHPTQSLASIDCWKSVFLGLPFLLAGVGTWLAGAPPTYWEIEAKGTARGADYEAYFLVPVYNRG
jgi:hypothetical protein